MLWNDVGEVNDFALFFSNYPHSEVQLLHRSFSSSFVCLLLMSLVPLLQRQADVQLCWTISCMDSFFSAYETCFLAISISLHDVIRPSMFNCVQEDVYFVWRCFWDLLFSFSLVMTSIRRWSYVSWTISRPEFFSCMKKQSCKLFFFYFASAYWVISKIVNCRF